MISKHLLKNKSFLNDLHMQRIIINITNTIQIICIDEAIKNLLVITKELICNMFPYDGSFNLIFKF